MLIGKVFFKSATSKLIILNVIVYFLFTIFSWFFGLEDMVSWFALGPDSVMSGEKVWTIFTSMFVHVQFWHLFVNMFTLFFIGTFVERLIGKKRFVIFYILSGLFAGIFWAVLSVIFADIPILTNIMGSPFIPGVGASGALFGLVGILAVLTPKARVYLIAGPIIAILIQMILFGLFDQFGLINQEFYSGVMNVVSLFVTIYFLFAIFAIMSFDKRMSRFALPIELEMWVLPIIAIVPLILISVFIELPIGNIAHLGGLIAGLGYAYYLKNKYPKKSRMISGMFQSKPRRREVRPWFDNKFS